MGHPHFVSGMNVRIEVLSPTLCGRNQSGTQDGEVGRKEWAHGVVRAEINRKGGHRHKHTVKVQPAKARALAV